MIVIYGSCEAFPNSSNVPQNRPLKNVNHIEMCINYNLPKRSSPKMSNRKKKKKKRKVESGREGDRPIQKEREKERGSKRAALYTRAWNVCLCARNTHTHSYPAVWVLLSYIYTHILYSRHYVQLCVQASGQLIRQLKSYQKNNKTQRKKNNLKTEVESNNKMCQHKGKVWH